jgi:hypothetical protein
MKIEVGKFGDGRSLKVLVRFEESSNFWVENFTWVPRLDEVEHLREVLLMTDEHNKIKKGLAWRSLE